MNAKFALITGSSNGLGAFLASRFWDSGFNLCLVAHSEEGLEKVARALPERKEQQIICFVCDLANPELVVELADKVRACLPRLDVLLNNAAIHGPMGPLWENDFSMWQQVIQVDLLAPVALCRAFVPWMNETGGGSIINLSGGGATCPRENFSAYATAKAGLVRFSETLAEEARHLGIRVNCIAPGAMKTDMLGEILKKVLVQQVIVSSPLPKKYLRKVVPQWSEWQTLHYFLLLMPARELPANSSAPFGMIGSVGRTIAMNCFQAMFIPFVALPGGTEVLSGVTNEQCG